MERHFDRCSQSVDGRGSASGQSTRNLCHRSDLVESSLRATMKTKYAVSAVLVISLGTAGLARSQEPANNTPTPNPTPAQPPPPAVVKREPVPSREKSPLAEAVRILESGDATKSTGEKHAPTVPALPRSADSHPMSSEVPRSFEAKGDVALNATGAEAVLLSREWTESRNIPVPGKDGRVVYPYGGGLPIVV